VSESIAQPYNVVSWKVLKVFLVFPEKEAENLPLSSAVLTACNNSVCFSTRRDFAGA